MWITALERKLTRELLQLQGQSFTIALVVASGLDRLDLIAGLKSRE
jgi:hypothetical protein